jgi:hypothetical protein
MGATKFYDSGFITRKKYDEYSKSDIRPLFNKLKRKSDDLYGHQEGYSGNINAKDHFKQCGVMTRKQYEDAIEWWNGYGNHRKPPKLLRDRGLVDDWKGAKSKWGSACAVVIKDEKKDATIVTGKYIKDKGYIPAKNREKKQYIINYYDENGIKGEHRSENATKAWKWANSLLDDCKQCDLGNIEHGYTYAKPRVAKKTKKGRKVKVKFFGKAPI